MQRSHVGQLAGVACSLGSLGLSDRRNTYYAEFALQPKSVVGMVPAGVIVCGAGPCWVVGLGIRRLDCETLAVLHATRRITPLHNSQSIFR